MSDSTVEVAWRRHRPYVVNLAYHLLGDIGHAEDVAQEAFLRLTRDDAQIDDVRGWLTVVAARLCVDHLRAAGVRRESLREFDGDLEVVSGEPDPADRVTLDDEVSAAMATVLSRLSPAERVAFVLHDVFGMPFEQIAEMVGRPVGTCRQLARRARARFTDDAPQRFGVSDDQHRRVTDAFVAACAQGDLAALASVLDPDVWGVARFLGAAVPPQTNHGRDAVATNLLLHLGRIPTVVSAPLGGPVVLGFRDRKLVVVLELTVRGDAVVKIEASVDTRVGLSAPDAAQ
jgi:RNA polymerase sigma-70 factor (ECF subfamily)